MSWHRRGYLGHSRCGNSGNVSLQSIWRGTTLLKELHARRSEAPQTVKSC